MPEPTPTIFALSSGATPSAIAVLRLSGSGTGSVVQALCGPLPRPRHAVVRSWRDPHDRTLLDRGILIWMPGPASFTGEDMAELHIHGSDAVLAAFDRILIDQGLVPAAPGEFSRRAFDAGKLDLTRAEAIADLIDAKTEQQRLQALQQMQGGLHDLYQTWRDKIGTLRAMVEATIDFPDDVSDPLVDDRSTDDPPAGAIRDLHRDLCRHMQDHRRGDMVRSGFRVVLVGAANAGKSSLFNAIVQRSAAIVSNIAGTTRDVLEVGIDIGGHHVIFTDIAGLSTTSPDAEKADQKYPPRSHPPSHHIPSYSKPLDSKPFDSGPLDSIVRHGENDAHGRGKEPAQTAKTDNDILEQEAIRRSHAAIARADALLLFFAPGLDFSPAWLESFLAQNRVKNQSGAASLDPGESRRNIQKKNIEECAIQEPPPPKRESSPEHNAGKSAIDNDATPSILPLIHKCDSHAQPPHDQAAIDAIVQLAKSRQWAVPIKTSAIDKDGIDAVLAWVKKAATRASATRLPPPTRERHHHFVRSCAECLIHAANSSESEIRAEYLRVGSDHLGRIVGAIDVEEVLDALFKDFCIGK